ncbi:unnamed protein product [Cuscuta campestris]|uniref:Peptidase A1 domain-containing protein n=1 Tax=Cuscuta campestris TaxID=132261 RepID=A0A484MRX5_9ASTE|nr:unnamed protein product [Cuscuta campestris]
MRRRAATTTQGLPGPATGEFAGDLEYAAGYYAMKFSIGTPPVERLALVDTGSDLTWIQCEPCPGLCFAQNTPLFDPSMSSSYTRLPCDTPICLEGGWYSCDTSTNLCHYNYSYMDASYTHGDLAYETLAIGDTSFSNFVFGCGFNNSLVNTQVTNGIFGLGNDNISFITQANIERFMYCLPWYLDANVSSHIAFDSDAVIADLDGVVSTPIADTKYGYYWITLENFSVGGKTVLSKPLNKSTSGMVVDSGSTLTYLRNELHDALINELRSVVKSTPVSDPTGGTYYKLCYNASDIAAEVFPTVAAHFAGGAVVQLSPKALLNFYVGDGVVCLPISNGASVWGNLSQIDYIILFDLVDKSLSFKPFDCDHF